MIWPKIEVFYRPEWTKENMKVWPYEPYENNLWVFPNSETNVTVRTEKVDEKMGLFV